VLQTPDPNRDVIVKHIKLRDVETGVPRDRWLILVGSEKRGESEHHHGALVFARLLADLNKRPVWVVHDSGDLQPVDPCAPLTGCSCC
jgi:hypothetical protein